MRRAVDGSTRQNRQVDVPISWSAVAGCSRRLRVREGRSVDVSTAADPGSLRVAFSRQTSLDLALDPPLPVRLPDGRSATVSTVHLHADDPAAFARALEERRPGLRLAAGQQQ